MCQGSNEIDSVYDTAFSGGKLVLSELAVNLRKTFCGRCYRGIVSAGAVSGVRSGERAALLETLGGAKWTLSSCWSGPHPNVKSPLVTGAADGTKQDSVRGIVEWFRTKRNVKIADNQVHYFDDNSLNLMSFMGTGFNIQQVSCGSREGNLGFCGGRSSEVVNTTGTHGYCTGQSSNSEM